MPYGLYDQCVSWMNGKNEKNEKNEKNGKNRKDRRSPKDRNIPARRPHERCATPCASPRRVGMRARKPAGVAGLVLSALAVFTGCQLDAPGSPDAPAAEDRFHEKSFSWDDPAATPALARTAARVTRFTTSAELADAVRSLDASLRDPGFADSLWKPVDHACDELSLALWNAYGTIQLGDVVVLDEAILRSRCLDLRAAPGNPGDGGDAQGSGGQGAGDAALGKSAGVSAVHPEAEVVERVYPYKMIGRSWDNYDLVVYKSTGAETQFKKHRTRLMTTAWWDTEASRIGVRAYLLNCGTTGAGAQARRTCTLGGLRTETGRNDDHVSQRDFSAGVNVTFSFPKTISLSPTKLKVSDAVRGMHSVDHAGIAFRAASSSGLTDGTLLVSVPAPEYVSW